MIRVVHRMIQPKHVHVIFKAHLDIAYTDLARNVVECYMSLFFPKAFETATYLNTEKTSCNNKKYH